MPRCDTGAPPQVGNAHISQNTFGKIMKTILKACQTGKIVPVSVNLSSLSGTQEHLKLALVFCEAVGTLGFETIFHLLLA